MKIDGEFLSHLHFVDDTYICINTPIELLQMLQELEENENQGLKMNKTKLMENGDDYSFSRDQRLIQYRLINVSNFTTFQVLADTFMQNCLALLEHLSMPTPSGDDRLNHFLTTLPGGGRILTVWL